MRQSQSRAELLAVWLIFPHLGKGGRTLLNCDTESCSVSGQLSASARGVLSFLQPVTLTHELPPSVTCPPVRDQRGSRGDKHRGHTSGEMVLLTMIARLADGLPLAASMQEDEQVKEHFSSSLSVFAVSPQARSNQTLTLTPASGLCTLCFIYTRQQHLKPPDLQPHPVTDH